MSTARLYRVILPVSDIDRATGFYREVLETEGERICYAQDPLGSRISFVQEDTVFKGSE